jgi:hypothetical protein
LAEALSNRPISDSVTFKAGIAQCRLGKVVSVWRMNAISKWLYSSYGRGINLASVTSHESLYVIFRIRLFEVTTGVTT